jgi:GMP synthase PP-ATPase subunit
VPFILELLITIKGDDRLALEGIQEEIANKVDMIANSNGVEVETVGQPIRAYDPDKERAVYVGRGLVTEEEADRIWGLA